MSRPAGRPSRRRAAVVWRATERLRGGLIAATRLNPPRFGAKRYPGGRARPVVINPLRSAVVRVHWSSLGGHSGRQPLTSPKPRRFPDVKSRQPRPRTRAAHRDLTSGTAVWSQLKNPARPPTTRITMIRPRLHAFGAAVFALTTLALPTFALTHGAPSDNRLTHLDTRGQLAEVNLAEVVATANEQT